MKIDIIFIILGISFTGMGVYLKKRIEKFQLKGRKTKAEIIDYIEKISDDSTYFYPRIKFNTPEGEIIEQTLDSGTTWKPKKILPSKQEIYYLKKTNKEYDIIINSSLWTSIFPNIFLWLGIIFLIVFVVNVFI